MISRRHLLLGPALPRRLRGAVSDEIRDVFASIASALSEGNSLGLMEQFDPAMEEYAALRDALEALVSQAVVLSSIRIATEAGQENTYAVELDWLMEIRPRAEAAGIERRREMVRCRLEKRRKKWRITSLEPVMFFRPPRPPARGSRGPADAR
jgi:hypothetical protein